MASARFFLLRVYVRMRANISLVVFGLLLATSVVAQSGGHTLWGDIKVDEGQLSSARTATLTVLLYSEGGTLQMRQTVPSNGRYRFLDLRNGRYDVVIEFESVEVARVRVSVNSPFRTDFRQDIELQWKGAAPQNRASVISATDYFGRSGNNKELFKKAIEASQKKNYEKAITYLKQIVASDKADFPAWQELGTMHFILKNFADAEASYLKAIQVRPDYELALINLGRVRIVQKNLTGAIEVLESAVKNDPSSAGANYFLGEAYLQARLGSKAVPYLNEAIKLDPAGMADAHLRLAALYNAKGLKDRAAAEYSAFLKQRPDYPDRKKLEAFILANKSP